LCLVVVAPGDDRYWAAQNLRERLVDLGEVVKKSVMQWSFDIAGFKSDKEAELNTTLTPERIAGMYSKNVKLAKSTEPISVSFVTAAISTHKRILSNPLNQALLSYLDANYTFDVHPIKSMYTLLAICDRASTPTKINFGLEGLVDGYRMDYFNIGEFTQARLKDPRQSMVSVLNLKFDARTYLLGDWLDGMNLNPQCKAKIRDALSSFEAVRRDLTPYNAGKIDLSWQATWPQSAVLTATFLEDMIYTNTFDGRYKDVIRSCCDIKDMLDYSSVAERIIEIREALAVETQPAVPLAAGGGGDDGGGDGNGQAATGGGQAEAATAEPAVTATGFDSLTPEDKATWQKVMQKSLSTYVKLIADTGSTSELALKIQGSPLAMMRGDPAGLVAYHFNTKQYGESTTRPDVRTTPLRDAPYQRLVGAVLTARNANGANPESSDGDSRLASGEIAILFDGGKKGIASRLIAPWRGTTKKSKDTSADPVDDNVVDDDDDEEGGHAAKSTVPSMLHLVISSDSLVARKKKFRASTLSLKQLESAHVVAHTKISLPERSWKFYPGTNQGDSLVGVNLPAFDSELVWSLAWSDKKKLYGKKHLIAVGGKTECAAGSASMAKRTDATIEPACFHPYPKEVYEALIVGFFIKIVFDLSPPDGMFAWACLLNRVAYIGITYTEAHSELLEQRLLNLMKIHMAVPSCPLYNPSYAAAIGIAADGDNEAQAKAKAKGAPKGKAKAKKAKATPTATNPPDDVVSDDPAEAEVGDDDDEVWDPLAD